MPGSHHIFPFVLQFLYGCIYTSNKLHGTCIQDFLHKYCTSTIVHHRDSSSHSFNYSCMAQKGCKLQERASYSRLKLSAVYSWSICVTTQVHLHECCRIALSIKLRGSVHQILLYECFIQCKLLMNLLTLFNLDHARRTQWYNYYSMKYHGMDISFFNCKSHTS